MPAVGGTEEQVTRKHLNPTPTAGLFMQLTEIISEAKRHVHGWEFAELSSVSWSSGFRAGGLWFPPHDGKLARIEMGYEQDSDVLWHEVFHSVFHNCPLKKNNGWWGEAFCNAFSEVTRQQFYKQTITPEDEAEALTNPHWRHYIVPCVVILRQIGFDKQRFADFWWDINVVASEEPHFSLADILKYSPETGNFL